MNKTDSAQYQIKKEPYYLPVHDEVELFEAAYAARMPIMLKGPTGCGKTRFVEYMAWKLGRPLITVACNEDMTASDLVGRFLLDVNGTLIGEPSTSATNVEALSTTFSGIAFAVVATFLPSSGGTTSYTLATGHTTGDGSAGNAPIESPFVPGEVIVRFREDVPLVATGHVALASSDAGRMASARRYAIASLSNPRWNSAVTSSGTRSGRCVSTMRWSAPKMSCSPASMRSSGMPLSAAATAIQYTRHVDAVTG